MEGTHTKYKILKIKIVFCKGSENIWNSILFYISGLEDELSNNMASFYKKKNKHKYFTTRGVQKKTDFCSGINLGTYMVFNQEGEE